MNATQLTWTTSETGISYATVGILIVGDVRDRDGVWLASALVAGHHWVIETFDDRDAAVAFVEERVG